VIPPPPAPDAVTFNISTARSVAFYVGVAAFGWLFVAGFYVGLTALEVVPVGWTVGLWLLPQSLAASLITACGPLWMLSRRPPWARLSAAGLEIGTANALAVLIPWSGVDSATVRGRSIFATLDVVPHPHAPISLQQGRGRHPQMRRRGGRQCYPVWAGLFPGGPGAVTAALRARRVPELHPPTPTTH